MRFQRRHITFVCSRVNLQEAFTVEFSMRAVSKAVLGWDLHVTGTQIVKCAEREREKVSESC